MDLLKRKIKSFDFADSSVWKKNRCATKHQRKLIKNKYRSLKRGTKQEIKKYIKYETKT